MKKGHKAKKQFDTLCAESNSLYTTSPSHQLPIYATAAYAFENLESGIEYFLNQPGAHIYSRYGNPTVEAVAQKIADLETHGLDMEAKALLTSSGMAALHLALESVLKPGDILVTQPILYGGTTELLEKVFRKNGVEILYLKMDAKELEPILKNNSRIKAVLIESPVNPTLECVDIAMICKLAHAYKAKVIADNTFATPFISQPFEYKVDIVVHSTTKFLHGHGASTGGVIVVRDLNFFKDVLWVNYKLIGSNASPFEAWLIDIGLKTLPLRMKQHCSNAFKLAKWFDEHPRIIKVNYPGLKSHPNHSLAKKQMKLFGSMMSIEVDGNLKQVKKILNQLKQCKLVATLGETDTIILHPASMSHLRTPEPIKIQQGISDNLVRISVGLESVEDIVKDWESALSN